MGQCEKLGLNGRPPRPIGSLGTSKIYRICGRTVLCYPIIFSGSDFYLSHDMALLTNDIRSELQFIGRFWRLGGRPTFCILISENNMRDPQFIVMLELLAEMKEGQCSGVKIRLGRLQNLISSACVEHIDLVHGDPKFPAMKHIKVKPFLKYVSQNWFYFSNFDTFFNTYATDFWKPDFKLEVYFVSFSNASLFCILFFNCIFEWCWIISWNYVMRRRHVEKLLFIEHPVLT